MSSICLRIFAANCGDYRPAGQRGPISRFFQASRTIRLLIAFAMVGVLQPEVCVGDVWQSSRVVVGVDGKLSYPADDEGNRIPDFSNAGYRGGDVPLPQVPVVISLSPVTGDNTARIQTALDEAGSLPMQASGHRGAVQLNAGVYEVSRTLRMAKSGVVLVGVGNGEDPSENTIIRRTGTSTEPVILAGGGVNDYFRSEIPGTRTDVTSPRVQVGARSLEVADASSFRVGDAVIVFQPSTDAWLDSINRGDTNGDTPWQAGEIDIPYHRYLTKIDGNTITLDAPVFNHLDRALAQSVVYRYDDAGVVREIGVENLFIDIVTNGPESEDHAGNALKFMQAENCWARRFTARHFVHSGVEFGPAVTRGTALECRAIEPHSIVTGARRYNFGTARAQLILFESCYASYSRHAYVTNGTSLDSGIVFLDCIDDHSLNSIEGHRRWSQGLLYDGLQTINPESSIILGLYNRGNWGTGHGWAAVHSVAWRCDVRGRRIIVQKPPSAQNYAIGCMGTVNGDGPYAQPTGFIEGTGHSSLFPYSLYRAQLAERLARESVDPLIGGKPLDGQQEWFLSDWFGYYGTAFAPWLLHTLHGPLYRHPQSTNESLYFYDDAMGAWWWTKSVFYPHMYRFVDGAWLWYHDGSSGPRWFYNYGSESWEES
jgi:hypothetical protein